MPTLEDVPIDVLRRKNLVKEICARLSKEEVDLVSDDPYFYLNVNGRMMHEQLSDLQLWNEEAGIY